MAMKIWLQLNNEPPIEVDDTPETLVPLMVEGYKQVHIKPDTESGPEPEEVEK